MTGTGRLFRDDTATGAVEFALVLPLLIIFMLGTLDVGRFMWEYNQAEKATQMGVRFAVATNLIPSGLGTYSFASQGGVPGGSPVPSDAGSGTGWFATATCTNSGCTCTGSSAFCATISHDSTAFANLVDRMKAIYGKIQPANVQLEYRNVGLGYAGDPNGPDVAPLVIVRLTGMTFQPLVFTLFRGGVGMPTFKSALTLEDGLGAGSN